jgi:hypothetical protein
MEGQFRNMETVDCTVEPVPIAGAGLPNKPRRIVQVAAMVKAERSLDDKCISERLSPAPLKKFDGFEIQFYRPAFDFNYEISRQST